MLFHTYRFAAPAASDATSTTTLLRRALLDEEATLDPAQPLPTAAPWPTRDCTVLVASVPEDTAADLDPAVHTWIEDASAGAKLEVLWRSMRIIWKSGRAFVQGPSTLTEEALAAVLDYALLEKAIANLDSDSRELGNALLVWQAAPETGASIAVLRQQLARATALSLRLVALRPYCELPSRTGTASPSMRLRTELLTQAQFSDFLGLVEHRLELVLQGLENQLQRAQEARRGWWEIALGIGIIVLLVIELAITLHVEGW